MYNIKPQKEKRSKEGAGGVLNKTYRTKLNRGEHK